ncbi:hypothetical protein ACFS2C_28110 [Prauserella oleivorans]|uniref:TubC N-terminal docking domain-containing protein n=1 Tax=Prauserella oleivorans TaxID=1478153 RepID=A0ABW5WH87_9PSEU
MTTATAPWTADTLLAAAVDRSRDRITVRNGGIRIDGRPATESELRLLAELAHSGLIDLNTLDAPDGGRCCWPTRAGQQQARRWRHYIGTAR